MRGALSAAGLGPADLAAIGLANQRETTVLWDRTTGLPLTNAIVWQDTRSDRIAAELARGPNGELVRRENRAAACDIFLSRQAAMGTREHTRRPRGSTSPGRRVLGQSTAGSFGT